MTILTPARVAEMRKRKYVATSYDDVCELCASHEALRARVAELESQLATQREKDARICETFDTVENRSSINAAVYERDLAIAAAIRKGE